MNKRIDNLQLLVLDLESRYGKDDVDVQRLQAELKQLELSHVTTADTHLTLPPHTPSVAKQRFYATQRPD